MLLLELPLTLVFLSCWTLSLSNYGSCYDAVCVTDYSSWVGLLVFAGAFTRIPYTPAARVSLAACGLVRSRRIYAFQFRRMCISKSVHLVDCKTHCPRQTTTCVCLTDRHHKHMCDDGGVGLHTQNHRCSCKGQLVG